MSTGWPARRLATIAAAFCAEAPMTVTAGCRPATAAPMPPASPPPDTPATTAASPGTCSSSSRPTVPCPAITSGSSNGCT